MLLFLALKMHLICIEHAFTRTVLCTYTLYLTSTVLCILWLYLARIVLCISNQSHCLVHFKSIALFCVSHCFVQLHSRYFVHLNRTILCSLSFALFCALHCFVQFTFRVILRTSIALSCAFQITCTFLRIALFSAPYLYFACILSCYLAHLTCTC